MGTTALWLQEGSNCALAWYITKGKCPVFKCITFLVIFDDSNAFTFTHYHKLVIVTTNQGANCSSGTLIIHTHSYTDGQHQEGFSVLLKDTSTHLLEGLGLKQNLPDTGRTTICCKCECALSCFTRSCSDAMLIFKQHLDSTELISIKKNDKISILKTYFRIMRSLPKFISSSQTTK